MKMDDLMKSYIPDEVAESVSKLSIEEKEILFISLGLGMAHNKEQVYPPDFSDKAKMQTNALLITLPKFVWDMFEKYKTLGLSKEGHENVFSMIIYVCASLMSRNRLSMFQFLIEIIKLTRTKEDE